MLDISWCVAEKEKKHLQVSQTPSLSQKADSTQELWQIDNHNVYLNTKQCIRSFDQSWWVDRFSSILDILFLRLSRKSLCGCAFYRQTSQDSTVDTWEWATTRIVTLVSDTPLSEKMWSSAVSLLLSSNSPLNSSSPIFVRLPVQFEFSFIPVSYSLQDGNEESSLPSCSSLPQSPITPHFPPYSSLTPYCLPVHIQWGTDELDNVIVFNRFMHPNHLTNFQLLYVILSIFAKALVCLFDIQN